MQPDGIDPEQNGFQHILQIRIMALNDWCAVQIDDIVPTR